MAIRQRQEPRRVGGERHDELRGEPAANESQSFALSPRTLLLIGAFWTLFGAFQASNWLFAYRVPYSGRVFASALINAYMWALLTPAVFLLASRLRPEGGVGTWRVLRAVGVGIAFTAVTAVVASVTHQELVPTPFQIGPATLWDRLRAIRHWYFQEAVTFGVVLVAGLALAISRRFRARERVAARLQAESAQLQAQLAEARLTVLRTRLNPHFLFNTLNAVSALVATDPRGVRNMIAHLSELLRYALSDTNEQEIPLRDELALLRLYLKILETRYQGRLRTIITANAEAQDALVPNLILQPLVENAVKHAIDRAGGHGTIEVDAGRVGDDLVMTVRDTGPRGGATASNDTNGVGLHLTRDRLTELYGTAQQFELEPATGRAHDGMTARVVLPYHTSDELRVGEAFVET